MRLRPIQPYVSQRNRRQVMIESPTGSARIDTVAVENSRIDPGRSVVLKMSHFGRKLGYDTMVIDDFVSSEVDLKTGEVLSMVSSIQSAGSTHRFVGVLPENFIGPDGATKESYRIPLFNTEEIPKRMGALHTNNYPITYSDVFEDEFNVPFTDTLGAIMGLLSASAQMIPFQANVIMDTDLGVNVRELRPPTDSEWKDALRPQFKNFIIAMNAVYKLFKDVTEKNEMKLRLQAVVHPFGVSFDLFDKTLRHHYHSHMNNSDHCRILKTLQAVDSGYLHGETLWNLMKTKFPSVTSSIFSDDDECDSFKKGSMLQPYETIFPWR